MEKQMLSRNVSILRNAMKEMIDRIYEDKTNKKVDELYTSELYKYVQRIPKFKDRRLETTEHAKRILNVIEIFVKAEKITLVEGEYNRGRAACPLYLKFEGERVGKKPFYWAVDYNYELGVYFEDKVLWEA